QERFSPVVELQADSPVALVSAEWDQSTTFVRGSARVFETQGLLILRNSGKRYIRGISLTVLAGESAPGGRGVVRPPVQNISQGAMFPVGIGLRLCRPVHKRDEAAVKVRLDGVLFDDLRFYGPDESNSRQWLTERELNACPTRRRLKSVLE